VKLTLYQAGACLEAEARTREWIWMRPPVVVVGLLSPWREKRRRRSSRARRELAVRLVLEQPEGGSRRTVTLLGQSLDLSEGGAAMMTGGHADVREGDSGRLTVQLGEDWDETLSVRVVRVRQWLRRAAGALEIGLQVEMTTPDEISRWQACLAQLGVKG
jgi:hypothetical protein